jgi:hypothetical protein
MTTELWISPNTGKGWTDDEEAAFAPLIETGLTRIQAIQMWKRFHKDLPKALKYAHGNKAMKAANRERAAKRVKGAFPVAESVAGARIGK